MLITLRDQRVNTVQMIVCASACLNWAKVLFLIKCLVLGEFSLFKCV